MSVRSLQNLDLIVAFLESLAVREQPINRCQLHDYTLQALQDKDIYGEVRKTLEEMEMAFRFKWPIDYKKMADEIGKYL